VKLTEALLGSNLGKNNIITQNGKHSHEGRFEIAPHFFNEFFPI
jgi:hypothetical protein